MPSIAPLVAALQRRLSNLPGPVAASGEAGSGQPVQVEMLVAGVWVDITSYAMVRDDSGQIRVTSGIQGGEGSQTDRAQGALQLKNGDGRFSPRNPSGPYYGLIGRNTPLRVSVPDGMGGKSYRVWGEATEWVPGWDTSGSDVWCDVTVSGIMQRLAQAPDPAHSVIYEAITDPLAASTVAYWPMEDASGSTTLASALASGSPMTYTGTPNLATFDRFPASDPVPETASTVFTGGVATYSDPTATQVRFFCYIPPDGLTNGTVICAIHQLDDGGLQLFELYYGNFGGTGRGMTLHAMLSDGTDLGVDLENTVDVRGRRLYVSIELQESGANITRALRLYDLDNQTSYDVTDTHAAAHLNRVTRVQFGPASRSVSSPHGTTGLTSVAIGHVTVENTITSNTILGAHLNPIGEAAGRRIQRLCGEEGIAFDWVGDLDDTVLLGAQGRQNLLALAQEATLADGGMLYENLAVLGLGYRTRASLYNQDPALVLDYAGFNLAQVPVPVEDDRYIQNKVTVTCNGVSATYEETSGRLSTALPPAGVGVYGDGSGVTLNLADTNRATLLSQAAWRVRLGTVDEARFPQISVNLAHSSITPDMRRAILGLRLGDRVQVINPPSWLPPDTIDQLVLGFEESITYFEHRITLTCAPASPYAVAVLDNAAARLDNDSVLVSDVSSSATSLVVAPATAGGPLWTTNTADLPFDIRMGGETMRVTSITPWLSDTFNRSVSSGWGTADTGQAWSTSGGSAVDYAVASGVGTHTLTSVNVSRRSFTDTAILDFDFYADIAVSATATGGSIFAGPLGRYQDSENLYQARLEFDTSSVVTLTIRRRLNSNDTVLGTYVLPGTYSPGVFYRVRFQIRGAVLRARAWLATDVVETPEWQVTATDSTFSTTFFFGFRSILSSANTNVNPAVSYDNVQVTNPQTFTVTRSINGVVKAQTAGAALSLANPNYISL